MSGYRKKFTAKLEIDGAEHVITLRPMTYMEGIEITDASGSLDPSIPEQKSRVGELRHRKARELMAAAIISVEPPVLDADGGAVSLQELCTAVYFANRSMVNAVSEWVNGSQPANPS